MSREEAAELACVRCEAIVDVSKGHPPAGWGTEDMIVSASRKVDWRKDLSSPSSGKSAQSRGRRASRALWTSDMLFDKGSTQK